MRINLFNKVKSRIKGIWSRTGGALASFTKFTRPELRVRKKLFILGFVWVLVGVLAYVDYREVRILPNSDISADNAVEGKYASVNPDFRVEFGDKNGENDAQIRFVATSTSKNPFENDSEKTLWQKVKSLFVRNKPAGVTMVLSKSEVKGVSNNISEAVGVDPSDMEREYIPTSSVELTTLGRSISTGEDDSVDTVITKDVADGVDVEYQILEGLGLKEEIVLRWRDEFDRSCYENVSEDQNVSDICAVPVNTYTFNLELDEGVKLKRSSHSYNGSPRGKYYFTDKDDNYLAHFLPSFAVDENGASTTAVRLSANRVSEYKYQITVSLDYDWLLSPERAFPVRIDPSIVHDSEAEFDLGEALNRVESISGPKVQLSEQELSADIHTVGLWHMNEDSGTNVTDFSGNNYDGTASGTTVVSGLYDDARDLNGTSDYIDVSSFASSFDIEPITISAWVKPDNDSSDVIFRIEDSDVSELSQFAIGDGSTGFCENELITIATNRASATDNRICYVTTDRNQLFDGNWHHITFISTGDRYLLYLDGEKKPLTLGNAGAVDNGNWGGISATAAFIGYSNYEGAIDEVRVSNIVRTPEEIKTAASMRPYGTYISDTLDVGDDSTFNDLQWTENDLDSTDGETPYSSTNLVAQWNFNATSGNSVNNDAEGSSCSGTPSNCDGTLVNFSDYSDQDVNIDSGWTYDRRKWGAGAITIDGAGDRVDIATDDPFQIQTFSFETWINPHSNDDYGDIFTCRNSSDYKGYVIRVLNTGELSFRTITSTGGVIDEATASEDIVLNKWHHIVATIEQGVEMNLYVDGELVGNDSSISNILYDATHYPSFGNTPGRTTYYDGVIDSTRFYSRVLGPDEIKYNYQNGKRNIEFMARSSTDNSTWEEWKPTAGETQLESMDSTPSDLQQTYDDTYTTSLLNFNADVYDAFGHNWTSAATIDAETKKYGAGSLDTTTNDYIYNTIGTSSDFDLGSDDFTIDFWWRPTVTSNVWLSCRTNTGSTVETTYGIGLSGGNLFARIIYGGTNYIDVTNTAGYSVNTWYHVAVIRNGSSIYVAQDGVLSSAGNIGSNALNDTGGYIQLGRCYNGSSMSNAYFDDFRYTPGVARWTSNFTPPQYEAKKNDLGTSISLDTTTKIEDTGALKIKTGSHDLDKYTVALWHLDETNGDNAGDDVFDETSNSYDGEFYGTDIPTAVVDGIYGKAREFNGTDDYISFGDYSDFDFPKTIEFWLNTTGNDEAVISKMYFGGFPVAVYTGYQIVVNSSGTINSYHANGSPSAGGVQGNETVNDGKWHYIVVVYGASHNSIYVDGELDNSDSTTPNIGANTEDLSIGIDTTSQVDNFSGIIDEVILSSEEKTAGEINEAYRAGRNHRIFTSFTSADLSSSSKIAFWVAADRPGTYLALDIGESEYELSQSDSNTDGLYRLEEESGTGAYIQDSSSNGNDGTPTNTSAVQGKFGLARYFDGSGDYITLSNLTNYSLTQSCWVKEDSETDWKYLVNSDEYAYINGVMIGNTISGKTCSSLGWSTAGGSADVCGERDASPLSGCSGTMTYIQAKTFCEGVGARLCTDAEVVADEGTGTGCSYDSALVWTSTTCGTDQKIVRDGSGDASNSCVSTGSSYVAQCCGDASITTTASSCFSKSTNLRVGELITGVVDEVRLQADRKTSDDIRHTYETQTKSHLITIDFAADLDSGGTGGLIANSADTTFTIDATAHGLSQQGSNLYRGDYVIVKENVSGTEYIAQGEVKSVVESSGETEVFSWDGNSTFPSGGFTANADVFKWQWEFFDITDYLDAHINALDNLSFRILDGNEGRNVWIDDVTYGGYLTDSNGTSNITSSNGRYFEYMGILTSTDGLYTPYISDVTLNYTSGGPTLDQLMRHGKWFSGGSKQNFWWGP